MLNIIIYNTIYIKIVQHFFDEVKYMFNGFEQMLLKATWNVLNLSKYGPQKAHSYINIVHVITIQ